VAGYTEHSNGISVSVKCWEFLD